MGDQFGIGKAVEKLMDPIADLVKRVAGPAADEVGLTMQDSIKVWRAKRQYKLFEKMNDTISKAGFVPNPIALKLLLPALDYASVEDNEDLHTIWANLLANAADPTQTSPVSPVFPLILNELTYRETVMLDRMFERQQEDNFIGSGFSMESLLLLYDRSGLSRTKNLGTATDTDWRENYREYKRDRDDFDMMLDVLKRHGLLMEVMFWRDQEDKLYIAGLDKHRVESSYRLSALGIRFVEACRPPVALKNVSSQ